MQKKRKNEKIMKKEVGKKQKKGDGNRKEKRWKGRG